MGILERFEKKVEGAVNGVFARAFKGDVQPVEIAARLQRELDGEAKLMSRDKRLVPNEFEVGLSQHDYDKLAPTARPSPNWQVSCGLTRVTSATSSTARSRSSSARRQAPNRPVHGCLAGGGRVQTDRPPERAPASSAGAGHLVLEVNGTRHPLQPPGLTIGRGTEADLRISDPSISRLHAQIRVSEFPDGQHIDIVDLGSTNGITVDGHKVERSTLGEDRAFRSAPRGCSSTRPPDAERSMSEIALTVLKVLFLALLWLFILSAVSVIRSDLFGRTASAPDGQPQELEPPAPPPRRPEAAGRADLHGLRHYAG